MPAFVIVFKDRIYDTLIGIVKQIPRITEMDSHGTVTNKQQLVAAGGFSPGMTVLRRADQTKGVIKAITHEGVVLKLWETDEEVVASCDSFLKGKWREVKEKAPRKSIDDWGKISQDESLPWHMSMLRAKIMHSMDEQWQHLGFQIADLKVEVKNVIAAKDFSVNKLDMGVATMKINIIPDDPETESDGIQIGMFRGHRVMLVGNCVLPKESETNPNQGFLNPTWFVKTSSKKTESNMEWIGFTPKADLDIEGWKVQLPSIRNFKKISQGDTLVLYQKQVSKTLDVEPLTKKPRV